ncbi:hypothetical protein DMC30DRAFT_447595 [Rhodotorula diobovata]|uniref:RING-type E3 ubiquitin transferase n=1 Tax=Rhodotorula diobovata TaxID=5288 RepID=A0A5C5FU24_9BASI|nr:hypothetical protein DMC30DRAFT_447595 [Rhodotorula diobovata]
MSEPSTSLPLELEAGAPAPPSAPAPVEPPTPVTPSEPETYPPSADDKGKGKATEDLLERFTCHICLEVPSEPVVTPCGHLHCWPCMHEWLVESSGRACPVCKAPLTVEKLVPIYAGSGEETDPRSAAATSYRSGGTGSAFSLQAGLFPLPGLSFGWTWPPPPAGDAGPAPHLAQDGGAPFLVAQPATLVRRADVDWRTALMQQVFMILFFAVFVAITLAG